MTRFAFSRVMACCRKGKAERQGSGRVTSELLPPVMGLAPHLRAQRLWQPLHFLFRNHAGGG